jgi:thiol:disulfide interchange protein DsbD
VEWRTTFAGWSRKRTSPRPPGELVRAGVRSWHRLAAGLVAGVTALPAAAAELTPSELLPAERAFELSVEARSGTGLTARFRIAEGYYLYRDKLAFAVEPAGLATPARLPSGVAKDDRFFGRSEIYPREVAVDLELDRDRGGQTVRVVVDSQGCADARVCYPAQRQVVAVALPKAGERPGPPVEAAPKKKSWFN